MIRNTVDQSREPATYEATLLAVAKILTLSVFNHTARVVPAASLLLAFDAYPRPGDWCPLLVRGITIPIANAGVHAEGHSVAFWPSTQQMVSKTDTQDDTVTLGLQSERPHINLVVASLIHGRKATSSLIPVKLSVRKQFLRLGCEKARVP